MGFLGITAPRAWAGEHILYSIRPLGGQAEYSDEGIVKLGNKDVKLIIFKTSTLGFEDTEKIYSDPTTFFALRVERFIEGWLGKEHIIEEYDQQKYTVTMEKFKDDKLVERQVIKSDGPIFNAVTMPFYLRLMHHPALGWRFKFRLPNVFEVVLDSVVKLRISGHTYRAYHFVSVPENFETWIDSEEPFTPIKISGKGVFSYTLTLKEYSPK
jgi:hypothetical protein